MYEKMQMHTHVHELSLIHLPKSLSQLANTYQSSNKAAKTSEDNVLYLPMVSTFTIPPPTNHSVWQCSHTVWTAVNPGVLQ